MITDNPSIDHSRLLELLNAKWHVSTNTLAFLPVGGASWSYRSGGSFVNVRHADDRGMSWDLERDVSRSFAAAVALRERCDLDFLLAPTPTASGDPTARLGQFLVVVMPFVDGVVRGGEPFTRDDLREAVDWVRRIHDATPAVADLQLFRRPFEDQFARPLREAVQRACMLPASASAFKQRLRDLVLPYRDAVLASLVEHESLVSVLSGRPHKLVVTHGEPDPQNVLESASGRRWLIDLGEIALAPPDLDFHVLRRAARAGDEDLVPPLDPNLARYYDTRFNLSEVTEYLEHLSLSDGADVSEDTDWDWRTEPEPEWRTEVDRSWGLLRYFLDAIQ